MFKVIFLDIDGVLNAHEELDPKIMCGRIYPDKVARLNMILEETGAMLVLSSAWRYLIYREEMTLTGVEWLFRSHGIYQKRLIGITKPDTMISLSDSVKVPASNERGEQISMWIEDNPEVSKYVVLDDLDLGISRAGHPFVHVNGSVGLTTQNAKDAIKLLV